MEEGEGILSFCFHGSRDAEGGKYRRHGRGATRALRQACKAMGSVRGGAIRPAENFRPAIALCPGKKLSAQGRAVGQDRGSHRLADRGVKQLFGRSSSI
jgi:hypothetical protein